MPGGCSLHQELGTTSLLRGKLERLQRDGGGGGPFLSQVHMLLPIPLYI